MKYELRDSTNRKRTQIADLRASKTDSVELIELDDEMLRRAAGGRARTNTCTSCCDVDC